MKAESNQPRRSSGVSLLLLLWLAVCETDSLHAQETPPEQPPTIIDFDTEYTTEPSDLAACRVRLHRIQEALDWHRERNHGALPATLSDLLGFYLPDETILICPFVERTGRSKGWRYGFRNEVWSDQQSSYAYEFSQSKLPLYGTISTTLHEYKIRQVEFLNRSGADGGVVPVIRCFAHRPVLNLSFAGTAYPSDIHWEDLPEISRSGITHHDLIANVLFADLIRVGMTRLEYPHRDPACGPEQLDLTPHYNASLTIAWHPDPPANDLSSLPHGFRTLGGQSYDVRGVIQLKGRMLTSPFPEEIAGIAVGRACQRIHFLHATAFREQIGTRIGHYRISYVDGLERDIPIVYGRDVEDWWFDPKPTGPATACTVAWTGVNEPTRERGMGVRLYHSQWENPRVHVEIATIDYVSAMTASAPFLIAITVE